MKGLYARIAIAFIGIASLVLLISTVTFIIETHYHFSLYQQQADHKMNSPTFDTHFEQALVQSVLWSAIIGIILAVVLGLLVAKRITAPLLHMRKVAERMSRGDLTARTTFQGKDELADLAGSLNHLAEQLMYQEHLRQTMTADVAHELRTPLATLKSHMEAMMDGVWIPTTARLASCYEEIDRLTFLVGDLEQLTEVEAPYFKLNLQEEHILPIVQHHMEACRAAFDSKGVGLYVHGQTNAKVNLDRQRVGQVMTNLLSNALKFTPQEGSVYIEVIEEPTSVVIVVSDTGVGIHEHEIPLVYERFYRADKSRDRKTGGSGIGLTIAKKLVEAHGGRIHIQSQIGRGTAVEIHFPKC